MAGSSVLRVAILAAVLVLPFVGVPAAAQTKKDCCRWLKEVEPACVCDALLRLPPFLVKPQHKYTVKVGDSCKYTYHCGGY
uniref:Bifunctional inhibitor/plant lipid transfer protein/seed storage helical domain-containing protein n=1 Tax=Oryza punctata TaxID=4537 RepID=A0A0E0LP77_ORYPU